MANIISEINNALHSLMGIDNKAIVVGEDILDPYGGAFKATKGLSSKYAERIIPAPISESLICGLVMGLAIEGYHPVGEIMFGDFMSLGFSQLIDNAAKYQKMFNNQIKYPFILRTPMGGGRGYGATHSQSIEKYFTSMQGIKVISINEIWDDLYSNCLMFEHEPVIIIENKILYGRTTTSLDDLVARGFVYYSNLKKFPTFYLSYEERATDRMTFITYGLNISYVMDLMEEYYLRYEFSIGLIAITDLAEYDIDFMNNYSCLSGPIFIV